MSSGSPIHNRNVQAVFAYGTLKRGQCRQHCWNARPLSVVPATIRGTLWHLGKYPGLTTGDELIRGELWVFKIEDMPPLLKVLDAVEGYDQRAQDLFVRREVPVTIDEGAPVTAWTYYYARTLLSTARKMEPGPDGAVQWR